MSETAVEFEVKLAETEAEQRAAQALRYEVFVRELGGGGDSADHQLGIERDRFDAHADHLLVRHVPTQSVVGVYRLLRQDQAARAGQFYSEDEYDLQLLKSCGRPLLELGRSCLHKDFRGGMAMYHLWNGLARYVQAHGIEVLFGVASFHGTDLGPLAQPLSLLRQAHLAPPELRVRAQPAHFQPMDLVAPDKLDRGAAMRATPALIKAYLRLGGFVGDGAYVDHAFNTTDVCLVLDIARMNERQRRLYTGQRPA